MNGLSVPPGTDPGATEAALAAGAGEAFANPAAQVIWITGLSGAGKTTIARRLTGLMRAAGQPVVLLDGDEVRAAVDDQKIGHDRASRLVNAFRICRLARLVAGQGVPVVVATMSLFKEVHAWNRQHLPQYLEVFVKVSLDVLHQRDARGLYSRANRGTADNVVGVHLDYDEPANPDLVLVNEQADATELARRVLERLAAVHPCRPFSQHHL